MKKLRETKGITLIALVITIIVLLILAGISISSITGENGIASKAKSAKTNTEIAKVKEIADIIAAEYVAETEGEQATAYYIISELVERNYIEESQVIDNGQDKEQGIIEVEGKEIIIKGAIYINPSLEYLTITSDGAVNIIDADIYYETSGSNANFNSKEDFPLEILVVPEEIDGITVTSLGSEFVIGKGVKKLILPQTLTSLGNLNRIDDAPDLEELHLYSALEGTITSSINSGYFRHLTIVYLDK